MNTVQDTGSGLQLVVCETTAAMCLHLREDDGVRKYGGGLKPTTFLCQSSAFNGWDTRIPAPVTPQRARASRAPFGYCRACLDEWERRLS